MIDMRKRLLSVLSLVCLLGAAPPPESPVADAAMHQDLEMLRTLVEQGADVNLAQADGMTALHWAAQNARPDLARVLLEAGARQDMVTRNGAYTPLHLASRAGDARMISVLLEAGGDPNAATASGGATPLHFAARSASVDAVTALLQGGASPDARETAANQTPLMWASALDRVEVVQALLRLGADPSLSTRVLHYPTIEAVDDLARKHRDSIFDGFRKEAGVGPEEAWRPTPEQVQFAVRSAQRLQRTPPSVEADKDAPAKTDEGFVGYTQMVGAQGGTTALLYAVREGNARSALALLDAGADVNQVSAGDHTSPLLMAVINGHFDLGVSLLERGADPNLASDAGTTPLFAVINTFWAPKARYPQQLAYQQEKVTYLELMEALLEAGADPDARLNRHIWYMEYNFAQLDVDIRGATAFWRAAYALDVDAMRLLVEHGADPHLPTYKPPKRERAIFFEKAPEEDFSGLPPIPEGGPGIFPIHAATGVGYGEGFAANSHRHAPDSWLTAVTYLVDELGADVNARDHNGYNAIHHAAARGDNEVIRFLVERGGDPTAISRKGQTTADMANGPAQRTQPYPATIKLLESLGSKNNNRCLSC